jgi:hypothetical protein
MPSYLLRQDGQPPLCFEGTLLAEGTCGGEASQHRFVTLTVYETRDGRIIFHFDYHTLDPGYCVPHEGAMTTGKDRQQRYRARRQQAGQGL